MILDQNIKLEAVLAAGVSANQPEVHVDYVDYNNENEPTFPTPFRVALNGNTDVTILAAPTFNPKREPTFISIYNKDTAAVTVTVKTDDGSTERIICNATLSTLEVLIYEKGNGWYALSANGGIKQGGVSIPGSSTDNAVVRWDGATGTAIQNSPVLVDDSGNVTGVVALTTTGLITTPASATGSAGLKLPHGAAPTSPNNGDIWTTTSGLFVRINGSTVGPLT